MPCVMCKRKGSKVEKGQGEAKSVVCTKTKRRNDLHQSGMILYEYEYV